MQQKKSTNGRYKSAALCNRVMATWVVQQWGLWGMDPAITSVSWLQFGGQASMAGMHGAMAHM